MMDFQKFEIFPYQGVGPIRFGMTHEEVGEYLGEFSSFRDSHRNTDYFGDVRVEFDRDSCRAVHIRLPFEPMFRGKSLLKGRSIYHLTKWLESLDGVLEVDESGITSYRFGIALYTQSFNLFKNKRPEEIMIFRVGYSDEFAGDETLKFRTRLNEFYRENKDCMQGINLDNF